MRLTAKLLGGIRDPETGSTHGPAPIATTAARNTSGRIEGRLLNLLAAHDLISKAKRLFAFFHREHAQDLQSMERTKKRPPST